MLYRTDGTGHLIYHPDFPEPIAFGVTQKASSDIVRALNMMNARNNQEHPLTKENDDDSTSTG